MTDTKHLTNSEVNILAAAMACSNIGFEHPDISDISRLMRRKTVGLWDAVTHFMQKYVEDDSHMDMFMEEAKGWKARIQKRSYATLDKEWPKRMATFRKAKVVAYGE